GNFRYGSPLVNLVADARLEKALGHFEYDDEGVKAQRIELVKEGIFQNYLTSRDVAYKLGIKSGGCARADGYNNLPLIRMTNINLEPGDYSLDELIQETKKGLMIEEYSSWSIDDKRLNFQFAGEIGWLIEDGELKQMVKNPTYTGITPRFWNSLDAITDKSTLFLLGVPNCGKGEPPQAMFVGHQVPYARFKNVRIGVMKR
ncbi:TldD/PmbA family protein, partial [bacterium]|nr:TldD/PmbA family protein [bacterium]